MSLAAVFLDLGNTLLTERPSRAEIYASVARRHGLTLDTVQMTERMARAHAELPREIEGAFRYSDAWFRAFQRHVFAELVERPAAWTALSDELFDRFTSAHTFVLYPGTRDLLAALRARGLCVGLISNWSERLEQLLVTLDLARSFDLVLGSANERMEKPDPAIFHAALQRARVAPEHALHAGDDPRRDAHGALSAGIAAVLVDHEGRLQDPRGAPCPVVRSLTELQDLILERCA